MSQVSENDIISEVLEKYPKSEIVIEKYFQSMCLHCPMATSESIGDGAKAHGADPKLVISEINELINKNFKNQKSKNK